MNMQQLMSQKKTMDLNEIEKRFIGQFGGRKGNGGMM